MRNLIQVIKDYLEKNKIKKSWNFLIDRESATNISKSLEIIIDNQDFLILKDTRRKNINIYKKEKIM